jgi:hypothetical protein
VNIFDNRQLAIIMVLLAFTVLLSTKSSRESFERAARHLFHPKVLSLFILYFLWGAVIHFAAWEVHAWNVRMAGDSIFWAASSGITLLVLSITNAGREDNFFLYRARKLLELAVVLEFFLNLQTLPLWGELLLQLCLTFLVVLKVVADHNNETSASKALGVTLAVITTGLLIYSCHAVISGWNQLDKLQEFRKFLLPVWLTIGVLPFVFVMALAAGYGTLYARMKASTGLDRLPIRSRVGVALALRLRLLDINGLRGRYLQEAAHADRVTDAIRVIGAFRSDRTRRAKIAEMKKERLDQFAGADGEDDQGRRLDQREFSETQAALRWLATCQMGWHNRNGHYRADLLEFMDDFTSQGLPVDHGIVMRLHKEGWYAYRRTVGGWVLGIGAVGPTPDQWFFDGPEPPEGLLRGKGWGAHPHEETSNWGPQWEPTLP